MFHSHLNGASQDLQLASRADAVLRGEIARTGARRAEARAVEPVGAPVDDELAEVLRGRHAPGRWDHPRQPIVLEPQVAEAREGAQLRGNRPREAIDAQVPVAGERGVTLFARAPARTRGAATHMSSRLRSEPSSRGMVPVSRFRARDLRERARVILERGLQPYGATTHRESKLPMEPIIEGIVPVMLFCWSHLRYGRKRASAPRPTQNERFDTHRCSRLFNKPSCSGMRPVMWLSWMSLPHRNENNHPTRSIMHENRRGFSQGFQIRASRDCSRDGAGQLGLCPPNRGASASAARIEARETVQVVLQSRRRHARANGDQEQ